MVSAIALFCQDVREEKAGTVSIIGVFTDNISVPKVPVFFPKLAIYARLSFPAADKPPQKISMRIVNPDNTGDALAVFDAELIAKAVREAGERGAINAGLVSTAMMSPFQIKAAGRLNILVRVDDADEFVCGTLNVELSPKSST